MEMSITRSRKIREKWNEKKMEMSITQPRKLEKMEWNPIERAAAVLGCILYIVTTAITIKLTAVEVNRQ